MVLLFSYGTLRDKAVQLANFGRELRGSPDSLLGYSTSLIPIRDPAVVATSGKAHHTIAVRSKNPSDGVSGLGIHAGFSDAEIGGTSVGVCAGVSQCYRNLQRRCHVL